jgi:hypothetical protein
MGFEPAVAFGFVGIEIVQNHEELFPGIVHEIQKFASAPTTIMSGMHRHRPSSHVQRGKERRSS